VAEAACIQRAPHLVPLKKVHTLMKALIIKKQWLDLIFSGKKSWELRSTSTKIRGKIGLIQSGSGRIMGTCELVDAIGPLTIEELRRSSSKHGVPRSALGAVLPYKRTFAWVLAEPTRFSRPRRYEHPQGAVIWVNV
jgi:hypothetical protein